MGGKHITTFREKYKHLCNHYDHEYNEEIAKDYYLELKDYGKSTIDRAFKYAIRTMKFFPRVSEIIEIIEKMPPEWFNYDLKNNSATSEEEQLMNQLLEEIMKKE